MNKTDMNKDKRNLESIGMMKVFRTGRELLLRRAFKKEPGIDGILVTVGLCIIALLLCVVMKTSMSSFIQTIVTSLTNEAQKILGGVAGWIVV